MAVIPITKPTNDARSVFILQASFREPNLREPNLPAMISEARPKTQSCSRRRPAQPAAFFAQHAVPPHYYSGDEQKRRRETDCRPQNSRSHTSEVTEMRAQKCTNNLVAAAVVNLRAP